MNYLSIDIGTTRCKSQLFSEKGEILIYLLKEYTFKDIDGEHYINIDCIWSMIKEMLREISKQYEIASVCISSLGESFVLLDKNDNILFYPMLYTDSRGEKEAEEIKTVVGIEKAFDCTGVVPHSMYSLSKLLWIKKNHPNLFTQADKVLLVGDYIGYLLTGKRIIDYGLAARTGVFDVSNNEFSKEMLDLFQIDETLFSTPKRAGFIVGDLQKAILEECEIKNNPVLILGSHDQICTALGSGALETGDAVDGMGTVECITTLFKDKPSDVEMGKQGYPCVPYVVEGLYCTYILNYSCGSTVNWFRKKVLHEYKGDKENFFSYIEQDMSDAPTGILTLPYFQGASTPYQDLDAKGVIIGLTTETRDCDLYKSIMEGTAFEMYFNAEVVSQYAITVKNVVATGGGANSEKWLQIKADIQNIPFKSLRSSEGGLCGCAMIQAVSLGTVKDYYEARDVFVQYEKHFLPNEERHKRYQPHYEKYKMIYQNVKELY